MSVTAMRVICAIWLLIVAGVAPLSAADKGLLVAAGPAPKEEAAKENEESDEPELTLEQKFAKRFPQPARVGDLIGLPVLDFNDSTIGYVKSVVRRPDGEVDLIVPYAGWFGWLRSEWGRRPVAVPLKAVAKLALQLNALEFSREDFEGAETWRSSEGTGVQPDEKISIALGRR